MYLTEQHEAIRDMTRRFADNEIRPLAAKIDEEELYPGDLYAKMVDAGLYGIALPEEHGGAGADTLAFAIVMEELSRGYASVADQCGLVEVIGTLLSRHGTPEQKEKFLRPLFRGKL